MSTARQTFSVAAWAGYVLMIAAAVGAFFAVRYAGSDLVAVNPPAATQATGGSVASGHVLFHVLLAMAVVIAAGRLLGFAFRFIGQPAVIGEVIAGIMLGPSLLGHFAPDVYAYILPANAAPFLGVVAQIGVILYMFQVGLELNGELLRERAHATVVISHASIVFPFVLGSALSLWLYPRLATGDVPFTSFALFLGVAMSITAFPVLARILTDRGMERTQLGVMALTCAATDDATAWCLLAFVASVARAQVDHAFGVLLWTIGYVALMFFIVGPIVVRLTARVREPVPQSAIAIVLVALLASSMATEFIGIHAIFGAFLLGALIPHDSAIARTLTRNLRDVVTVLLLPAFFALTGMRTEIGLLASGESWLICLVIILVATVGKFGGTFVASRLTGCGWRDSASLGILMNTRGLMELIVLNIGLELGVISPTLFAMMVLMAVATTLATTPVLNLLHEGRFDPHRAAA